MTRLTRLTSPTRPTRPLFLRFLGPALAAVVAATTFPMSMRLGRADDVVAVLAIDGYADLKSQLGWLGRQIDQPGLAAMAETLIMGVTGGKGLGGLDVKRPLGVIVTAKDEQISGAICVPVKDLDRLLGSLEGVIGPAEKDGETRRIAVPAAGAAEIVEHNGWAMVAAAGMPAPQQLDPAEEFATLVDDFTLAVRVYPSRLPEAQRQQLGAMLQQAAAQQGGNPQLAGVMQNLDQLETLTLGLGIDEAGGRVLLENRSVATPGSAAAAAVATDPKTTLSVPMPTIDEPLLRLLVAQRVDGQTAAAIEQGFEQAAEDNDDPSMNPVIAVVRELLGGMLASGRLEATMVVSEEGDTIAMTAGSRVADGGKIEKAVKQGIAAIELPDAVRVRFDTGRAGEANLHEIEIDVEDPEAAEAFGNTVSLTLAVAPEYAFLLSGGDAAARAEKLIADAGREKQVRAGMAFEVAVDKLLDFAGRTGGDESLAAAAKLAAEADSASFRVVLRPIERGLAWQAAVDAGVLKAFSAFGAMPPGMVPQAIPAGGGFGP